MIVSRLTLSALLFAVIGTTSLAFAATVHQAAAERDATVAAKPVRVIQLEPVVVIAKRLSR